MLDLSHLAGFGAPLGPLKKLPRADLRSWMSALRLPAVFDWGWGLRALDVLILAWFGSVDTSLEVRRSEDPACPI